MTSLMVFKTTQHVKASGQLDYFEKAAWNQFMVLLYVFLHSKTGHHSLQLFGRLLQRLVSVKESVLWTKNFT